MVEIAEVAGRIEASGFVVSRASLRSYYAPSAQTWEWAALQDATVILKNSSPIASGNTGDTGSFTVAAGDVVTSNLPVGIFIRAKARPAPCDFIAGRAFGVYTSRYNPITFSIFAVEATTVTYLRSSTTGIHPKSSCTQVDQVTLAAGQTHDFVSAENGSHYFVGTGDFVMESVPDPGDGLTPLPASHTAMLWRNYSRLIHEGSQPTLTAWSGAGGYLMHGEQGVDLFSVNGIADGGGGDTDPGVPLHLLSPQYLISHPLADWVIGTVQAEEVVAEYWDGTRWVTHTTYDFSGASVASPKGAVFGNTSGTGVAEASGAFPWRFRSTDDGDFYLRINDPATDDEYAPIGVRTSPFLRGAAHPLVAVSSLLAAAATYRAGESSLGGTGAIFAAGTRVVSDAAQAALSGSGSLYANGELGALRLGSALLGGSGLLFGNPIEVPPDLGIATLGGTGSLLADGSIGSLREASSSMASSGNLYAIGYVGTEYGDATLQAVGSLHAAAEVGTVRFAVASVDGAGAIALAEGTIITPVQARGVLGGSGSVSAKGSKNPLGSAELAATGGLVGAGEVFQAVNPNEVRALIDGVLDAVGSVGQIEGSRTVLVGVGSIEVGGAEIVRGEVELVGFGAVLANGEVFDATDTSTLYRVTGALDADLTIAGKYEGLVSMSGVGSIIADLTGGSTRDGGFKRLVGRGFVAAFPEVLEAISEDVLFPVRGEVLANGIVPNSEPILGEAVLVGEGSVSSGGALNQSTAATLTGRGLLAAALGGENEVPAVYIWDGGEWILCPVLAWNGSEWKYVDAIFADDGSAWRGVLTKVEK